MNKETISVHLGPGWYIENQDTKMETKKVFPFGVVGEGASLLIGGFAVLNPPYP